MNAFTKQFDNALDAIQSILMSILVKIGPFFVALMPALFTAYAIYHTFKGDAGPGLALFFGVTVALAMEATGIVAIHTSVDLYNAAEDKTIQPIKFWLMVALIPFYVGGVSLVIAFSQDAFTPLVKSLGIASPFLTTVIYVAVALRRDVTRIEAKQEQVEDKQAQLEADQREWERERERLEMELKHSEKLARIESKNRPGDRPKSVQEPSNKAASLDAILDYLNANPDASLSKIGQHIGRPKSTVGNYVNELVQAGRLHKNGNGWEVRQ